MNVSPYVQLKAIILKIKIYNTLMNILYFTVLNNSKEYGIRVIIDFTLLKFFSWINSSYLHHLNIFLTWKVVFLIIKTAVIVSSLRRKSLNTDNSPPALFLLFIDLFQLEIPNSPKEYTFLLIAKLLNLTLTNKITIHFVLQSTPECFFSCN